MDDGTVDRPVRCSVCGREFEDEATLEHHVRDQGLLW
ncbi:C2H2-type zinc finger protein [Halobacteria archaeon HArc-gm2]|nr:C2H2-type zinc finger protein [Halobacteria archaeon HArc-gm2]